LRPTGTVSQSLARSFSRRSSHKHAGLLTVTLHSKSYFKTLSCALVKPDKRACVNRVRYPLKLQMAYSCHKVGSSGLMCQSNGLKTLKDANNRWAPKLPAAVFEVIIIKIMDLTQLKNEMLSKRSSVLNTP